MKPMKRKDKAQGIFVGKNMQKGKSKPEFTIFGYVKPEDKHWIAVCVNMCLVGQGKNPKEALEKLVESASSYIQALKHDYPRKWKSKLECESPPEFIKEFNEILNQLKPLFDSMAEQTAKKRAVSPPMPILKPNMLPGNIFVQPISANYA